MLATVMTIAILAVIMMLSGAANLVLRTVSFARLTKLLVERQRAEWAERLRLSLERFVLTTAIIRLAGMLGVVLTTVHILRGNTAAGLAWYYAEVFVASALIVSIFGVGAPQALAKYNGERLLASPITLPVLQLCSWLCTPVILVLQLFEELIRRLSGAPKVDPQVENEQIEQEVMDVVTEAETRGAVDREEREMIKSVMELDEDTVDHIMTPRTELVAVGKDITLAELKALIKEKGHSRIPVYDGNIDNILGMVYAKDLLYVTDNGQFDVTQHLRNVPFVPETKSLRDLLSEFKTTRIHAAIVLDEYGGTAGLATIEDILEELVGEITDEYEQPEPEPIVRISDHVVELDSRVHVDELNEQLKLNIPEDDDYETIGGFVFSALGRIPPVGEEISHSNIKLTVLEAEDRRIKRLRLEVLPQPAEN